MNLKLQVILAAGALISAFACAGAADDETAMQAAVDESLATGDSDIAGVTLDENDVEGIEMDLGTGPDYAGASQKQGGACIRTPFGPGWVNWGMANPSGSGFSVKPESSWSLIWATAPSQNCDGVYRRSWGCNSALKVPDSCTANVASNGSVSCCCNAALAALGYVCQWVNPSSPAIGWPACPL
jgi:hypothetical protein